MGDLALVATAFAFGVGSSILPVFLNAEAYVIVLGTLTESPVFLFWLIMALSVGTVLGKVVVFDLARKGRRRLSRREREPGPPRNRFTARVRTFSNWLLGLLDRPYLGATTVFVSSAFMVPPLAIVSILAGASRQPMWLFSLMVFIGRTLQYLAIAFVLHHAVS
ncbi:MAG: VTT domain-containing protein [Aeromicrobium sp.]|uniref:VTT domain-containing protein n=1 Tax=Aeromicrobium sp. TaxID=1871063 RepID=UPI00263410B8|nr:VTT domain-containing protein [Aeromicrobium sp.]MDF1704076.1 VTT domain-containing protein [Aeromicrobium sp.]